MFTRAFWSDAAERAIKTFAQTLLATFGAGALDVLHADWGNALALGGGAAVLSVLTSVVSSTVHDPESASLIEQTGRHAAPGA
jgi:hypothetical protein